MNQPSLSPVALFVFARPEHTRRTLQSLSQNHLADKTKLYVFADGPRETVTAETQRGISEVRKLIRERYWCGEVEIIEAANNKGLADSIISGVSLVTERHGRAIILEDDLETSPGFLKYMNDALDLYANEQRVMQISGFNVRNSRWIPETGFLRVSTSWGWATWRRAWEHYQGNAQSLLTRVEQKSRTAFDLDGHSFHFEELQRNVTGDLNTWAVKWYASIFLNDGLSLYPRQTLVRNHGFDGSGVNCHDDESNYHRKLTLAKKIKVAPQSLEEQSAYLKSMQRHYDDLKRLWTKTRFRDRLARRLGRLIKRTTASKAEH
jgi:hypothetical protein